MPSFSLRYLTGPSRSPSDAPTFASEAVPISASISGVHTIALGFAINLLHFLNLALRNVVRLGKSRSVQPGHRVFDLKPRQPDRQPHKILRPASSKHQHVPARFEDSQALVPHGRWGHERVPRFAHEAAPSGDVIS